MKGVEFIINIEDKELTFDQIGSLYEEIEAIISKDHYTNQFSIKTIIG